MVRLSSFRLGGFLLLASAAVPAAALNTASGVTAGGLAWEARSLIVGQTSTATVASGGSSNNLASFSSYSGVGRLRMTYGGSSYSCTGTLLSDRVSILTAAHCVTIGGALPTSTTFSYRPPDEADPFLPNSTYTGSITGYIVHPDYTGEVIDDSDIAILRLAAPAPSHVASYGLATLSDPGGRVVDIVGQGTRSSVGGALGTDAPLGTGYLRYGRNRFEYRWGDPVWGGYFTDSSVFGSIAEYSYVSDFDNGNRANDASCILAAGFGLSGTKYCNRGVGTLEVGVAGGDSGGPQFFRGRLAGVTSYGLTFGTATGDYRAGLQSSWGEFSGFVPISIHRDWITANLASPNPEPGTWAMLILGFGFVGTALRRRAPRAVA